MIKSVLFASVAGMVMLTGTSVTAASPSASSGACATCGDVNAPKLAPDGPKRMQGPRSAMAENPMVDDRDGINVCCAPITKGSWQPYFRVQQSPGKNITQTYGLTFLPTPALDAQMKAYAPFAGLFTPNGWVPNSVHLDAELRELTVSPTSTPTAADFSGTVVYQHSLRAWWTTAPSGIWNGPDAAPISHGWERELEDNIHVTPAHMQPNKWYMVRLTLKLASKDTANPPPQDTSWHISNINCMVKYVAVIVRSTGFKTGGDAAGAAAAAQIVEIK